jgi:cytoskeletal protein CcmA (bactofilin family)
MSGRHSGQSRGSSSRRTFRRSRSIKSDDPLVIQGPLDIQGSVKSGGSIRFDGDFMVKDKIDAYGAITIDGNVSCESVLVPNPYLS